jgi:integrase
LYTVQLLLGHANAKATQRYAHLAQPTLADAADTMGKVIGPLLKQVSGVPEKK